MLAMAAQHIKKDSFSSLNGILDDSATLPKGEVHSFPLKIPRKEDDDYDEKKKKTENTAVYQVKKRLV